ncbi:MAG: DUF4147 domain-containing protein, partial [Clostridia bacterium]|nr:DUF4147 domain-containing protein [Clostridia bacterium]
MIKDVKKIYTDAIRACLPDSVVRDAVARLPEVKGKLYSVAIGKAAWKMSSTAAEELGERLAGGIVITKYDHSMGDIPRTEIFEAGHPVPDENTIAATERVLEFTSSLTEEEVERLFKIIRKLKEKGCGIIYISHKMEEILNISDDVTIMRD